MHSLIKWAIIWLCFIAIMMGQIKLVAAVHRVSFMLDSFPNPNHVPLYVAQQEGYFKKEGLDVDFRVPSNPGEPIRLVADRKVMFALSSQPEVIMARSDGFSVISIGSLVDHPLRVILFLRPSGFRTPADIKNHRIGYSGDRFDKTLFVAVAEKAGLNLSDYQLVHVGLDLVAPLLNGKVDAVIGAFLNQEAIQVEMQGKEVDFFRLNSGEIPDFDEFVIITHPQEIQEESWRARGVARAIRRSIKWTLRNPDQALKILWTRHPELITEFNRRSFKATLPFLKRQLKQNGSKWIELQRFMVEKGLIRKAIKTEALFWLPERLVP